MKDLAENRVFHESAIPKRYLSRHTNVELWQFIAELGHGTLPCGDVDELESTRRKIKGRAMNTAAGVIERLIEIGRAVGVKDAATVRSMVADAQDCVLQWQKEYVNSARVESRTINVLR